MMRKLRLRFSLRSFFIIFTVFAVVMGTYVGRCQQQRRAVAAIERLGGTVIYDYAYHYREEPGETSITINATPPDSWIVRWFGRDFCHTVVGVWGYRYDFYLPKGREFVSFGPVRRDTEFNRNTDQALRSLRGLRSLQFLDLSDTQVTNAGLVELESLGSLKELHLGNTEVTDEGLEALLAIRDLAVVRFWTMDVSVKGVQMLKSALPKLQVWHESTTEVRDREYVLRDSPMRELSANAGDEDGLPLLFQ